MAYKSKKKQRDEEIEHLKHMETTIIPIFIAITIFGLTLWISIKNILNITLISYLFGFSFVLSLFHIKALIFRNIRDRIVMFFIDATFLVVLGIDSMSLIPDTAIKTRLAVPAKEKEMGILPD